MELLDQITTIIKPILETNDVYLDDIEYVKEGNEMYLRIYIEKNNGALDMDTCVTVSEAISLAMDEQDPIKDEYYLEVSSPGAEKQLKNWEQVQDSIGHYVYAQFIEPTSGNNEVEGTIISIEDTMITFEYLVKNIKKKMVVDYKNIKYIRLAVKF
ncbi:ribosome maturation factor RimP [Tannockella kyphosi]|uniref:ribosome maturation factor RimP n=1 Tax=Tannockella kyphosi TaxID=2899121 RepID=UPI00201247C1|nr:ribosome maturation factor RimP [Tannockella kyphosi]